MQNRLPDPEHIAVVADLVKQAADDLCACGKYKGARRPFCMYCSEHLYHMGMYRSFRCVLSSMHNGPKLQTFEWLQFELCGDILHAFRTGRFNPKAKPKSLEDPESWN